MTKVPRRFARPADGFTVETEPDADKAARLLGVLRWMTQRNVWTLGITVGEAQYMVVRYRPKPYGPHPVEADLSGQDL